MTEWRRIISFGGFLFIYLFIFYTPACAWFSSWHLTFATSWQQNALEGNVSKPVAARFVIYFHILAQEPVSRAVLCGFRWRQQDGAPLWEPLVRLIHNTIRNAFVSSISWNGRKKLSEFTHILYLSLILSYFTSVSIFCYTVLLLHYYFLLQYIYLTTFVALKI